jgi:hypothetical protein
MKTQPALLGGLLIGVLSSLPYIEYGNACCCLWVVLGGAVAAYLLQERQVEPITAGDGALVGLMAGAVGAIVGGILSGAFDAARGFDYTRALEDLAGGMDEAPRELRDAFERLRVLPWPVWMVLNFLTMLMAGVIFSTLGGLLGALIFKKKGSAPPPPPPGFVPPTFEPPPTWTPPPPPPDRAAFEEVPPAAPRPPQAGDSPPLSPRSDAPDDERGG